MIVCSAYESSLSEDSEMQRCAGLGKDGPGMVVSHVTDVKVIHLKAKKQKRYVWPVTICPRSMFQTGICFQEMPFISIPFLAPISQFLCVFLQ